LIGSLAVVSSYFADSWKSLSDFADTVEDCVKVLDFLTTQGASRLHVGVDGQLALRANCEGVTGPRGLGPVLGMANNNDYEERHQIFLDLLLKYELLASTTFAKQRDVTTFTPHGASNTEGRRKQLDYVLFSRDCHSYETGIINQQNFHGDHFPCWVIVKHAPQLVERRVYRRNFTGWTAKEAEGTCKYKNQFDQLML